MDEMHSGGLDAPNFFRRCARRAVRLQPRLTAGLFLKSVAPAISGLPADIMQSRKKVFEFTFVFVLGDLDCFAHHAAQAFQLVAGEFDEVAFHVPVLPSIVVLSGHDRLRLPVPFVPITDFVDTSRPHNANDNIKLGEMKLFGKAVLRGGRPST